jgi:hypothetical protein
MPYGKGTYGSKVGRPPKKKKEKYMGGGHSMLSRYDDGGMATPKVTEKEKEMYGEDAEKFTSLYNSYMQSKEKADTPEQMETNKDVLKKYKTVLMEMQLALLIDLWTKKKKVKWKVVR